MIVCICRAINEATINVLLEQGMSVKDIITKTGACSACGKCKPYIAELSQQLSTTSP